MCNVQKRQPNPARPLALFVNRQKTRRILNIETLCAVARLRYGLNSRVMCLHSLSLCDRMRTVHTADILVMSKGSDPDMILPFAHRGTVVIIIQIHAGAQI